MTNNITLRDVKKADLAIFFQQQLDKDAIHMAAFVHKDPTDREAFDSHWATIMRDKKVNTKTIMSGDKVVGSIAVYEVFGDRQVTYWIGKAFWGQGIATAALTAYLGIVNARPLFARAAWDNERSIKVLEKCGFAKVGDDNGFANGRGEEIDEVIYQLGTRPKNSGGGGQRSNKGRRGGKGRGGGKNKRRDGSGGSGRSGRDQPKKTN